MIPLSRPRFHISVTALEKDVRDWIENWNHDPKPCDSLFEAVEEDPKSELEGVVRS